MQLPTQNDSGFWEALFLARHNDLQQACPRVLANKDGGALSGTPDTFQEFVERMIRKYSEKRVSRGLKKISATLDHVKSFSGAFAAFAQADMAGMIIWGSLQIVIEVSVMLLTPEPKCPWGIFADCNVCQCVCRFSNDIDTTLALIADMNIALPLYDQALALHPNKKSLQYPLQDLFNEYIDCCLIIMKEFSLNPLCECLPKTPNQQCWHLDGGSSNIPQHSSNMR